MILHVLRVIFVALVAIVAMRVAEYCWRVMPAYAILSFALGLACLVIALDIFIPQKSLLAISGLFFGLVVGMVVAFGLGLILDAVVLPYKSTLTKVLESDAIGGFWPSSPISEGSYSEEDAAARRSGWDSDGLSGSEGGMFRQLLWAVLGPSRSGSAQRPAAAVQVERQSVGEARFKEMMSSIKVLVGVVCCYLAVSFILQTKDDIRFVIPYVEFVKQRKGEHPLILDTSVIIDGRIIDILKAWHVDSPVIIPRFVLQELHAVADSGDKLKRNRGRRGLDVVNKLQELETIDLQFQEARATREEEREGVDHRLVFLARKMEGRLVTNDYNLNKLAQIRGVDVININDLANALKPVFLPGETMQVKIIKPGEEVGQGVGYLEDGTMIVVEGARDKIGQVVTITVTSVLQTSAGRMVFGRMGDAPPPPDRSRRRQSPPNRPST